MYSLTLQTFLLILSFLNSLQTTIETFWSHTYGFSNINSKVLPSLTIPSPSFLFLVVSQMEALNHKSLFLPSGNKRTNSNGSYRPGFTFLILLHLSELNSYKRSHPLGRITWQFLQLFPTHPKPIELFWWTDLPWTVHAGDGCAGN